MKQTARLVAALALAISGAAWAAGDHAHAHDHQPLHGGVVVEAGDIDFELVARADAITLHVRDHGKPASTRGATARLTLLTGSEKTEATLAPAGDNRLEARGSFKVVSGSKVVATVALAGRKPLNVRFALK